MLYEILGGIFAYLIITFVVLALCKASAKDCESYYNDPDVF